MQPIQLFDQASSTYTYVLFDETSRDALIIDPVDNQLERDLGVLRQFVVTADYVGGAGSVSFAPSIILAGARPVHAGEGHDHGGAAAAPSANGPQRLPDGGVFLPKPAQRQLGVRTLLTQAGDLPRSFELSGKVVMDPNAGGKVQPLNAGRIEPGPRGLPDAGQAVRKGEVLAYVKDVAGPDSVVPPILYCCHIDTVHKVEGLLRQSSEGARQAVAHTADAQVLADFAQRQVVLMRADWTRRDPAITQAVDLTDGG